VRGGLPEGHLALMNRDYAKSVFVAKDAKAVSDGAG
jgi:hypothetical protein